MPISAMLITDRTVKWTAYLYAIGVGASLLPDEAIRYQTTKKVRMVFIDERTKSGRPSNTSLKCILERCLGREIS